MDYKYIEQLLERYWECETSLEEENILRTFFSQDNIPVSLLRYKSLFSYEQKAKLSEPLGDDFDQKILAMTGQEQPVKARVISLHSRLMPLFKAAAIVAIIITLGNAMQMAFTEEQQPGANVAEVETPHKGASVAVVKTDSVKGDTLSSGLAKPERTIVK